jgi:SAM-dependent methyltransferase
MDRAEAIRSLQPYVERARSFTGWSFPKDAWRRLGPPLPWDYRRLVSDAGKVASSVLDIGTGGGEFLAEIYSSLPERTVATEEWHVNVPIARRRLAEVGIETVHCRSVKLPFKDSCFDLVVDRHEELDPKEVARVIRPGGKMITQQVDRNDWMELRAYFANVGDFGDHRKRYAEGFEAEGLKVTTNLSKDYKVAYSSLGEFVFMLAATPWTIPGFNLERDIEALLSLEKGCRTENGLELTESRYLLIAEKKGW